MRVGANPHRAAEPIGATPESIDWLSNDEVTEFNPMSLLRSNSSSSSSPLPVCNVLRTDPALSVSVQDCVVPLLVLTPPPSHGGGLQIDSRAPKEKGKLGAELYRSKEPLCSRAGSAGCAALISPFLYLVQPPRVTAQLYNAVTNECFFFRAKLKEREVHALADTGASENFVSLELAQAVGLLTHKRKNPLWIKIANGERCRCDEFARGIVRIGTWKARMSFVVLPGGPTMILGMPFFLRTEPQIRWRERAFVVLDGNTTHVLRADMLTPAETEAAAALDYVVWDAKRMLADVMDPPRPSSPTTVSTTGGGG